MTDSSTSSTPPHSPSAPHASSEARPAGEQQADLTSQRSSLAPRLWLLLLGLLAFTFLLRAFHVGQSWDIHVDELTYLNISHYVAQRLQVRLYGEPFYLHPPAYFFLEAGWLRLTHAAGDLIHQVYAARYLNVLLGTLTSGLLFLLGRRILNWQAGLTAALLFALDPFVIRSNSQTLLDTSALFWALLGWYVLFGALGRGRFRGRDVLLSGVTFGLALLTKEMLVFLTVLPLGLLWLLRWSVPRRIAAAIAGLSVLTYLPYPLIVYLVGDWRLFMDAKFSGVSRFVGATKVTGFKRAGGPSLLDAVISNLQTFATTYLLVLTGLIALFIVLRRGGKMMRTLAVVLGSAYLMLGFSVLIGTLEEQFFYYLVVPCMLATGVAAWLLLGQPSHLRRSYVWTAQVLGGLFVAWTLFVWGDFHLRPSNGYEQLRSYLRRNVAPHSRMSTLTEESVFLVGGYTGGIWNDLAALRSGRAQYAVLSTQQTAKGYGYATPEFKTWLDQNARLLASFPSRSYGRLNLYKLPDDIAGGASGYPVTAGRDGWLYLTSEYLDDVAAVAHSAQAANYVVDTVSRLAHLFRDQGQTLEMAVVPTKARVYAQYLPRDIEVSQAMQERYSRAVQTLQKNGVLAPDLATAFVREAARPQARQLYFKQDHHWTPEGAQFAAQVIEQGARGHVDLGGLPPYQGRVQVLPPTPAPLHSLADLLPAKQRQNYKPELYRPLEAVETGPASGGLLETTVPGVTLVGSSFSAIESLKFAPLLSVALSRDVLNVSSPGIGSLQPMTAYLRSGTYHQTPPRLIVWEMWEEFLNNQGVAKVPIDFLLNTGADVLNRCAVPVGSLPEPVWNPAGKYFDYVVSNAANPLGNYLHLNWKAPGQTRVKATLVAESSQHSLEVPLANDGQSHDLNVPIFNIAGQVITHVRVYASPDASAAPEIRDSRLCRLPGYLTDASYLRQGDVDLLSNNALSRTGLGEIETTGHRWGVGREATISFFSSGSYPAKLHLKFRSPVDGQALAVVMNGQRLAGRADLHQDDVTDLLLDLRVRPGLNTLSFTSRLLNVGPTRFARGDGRPLSVEFLALDLDHH